jgi:hypothetical protein
MAKARVQNRDRYPNGRVKAPSQKELEAANQNVVILQRIRHHGAPDSDAAKDDRYGTVLGRLWLQQAITGPQHEALLEYGRRRDDWLRLKVDQNPNPASPGFAMVSRGLSCAAEPDEEITLRKIRKHADMMRELQDLDRIDRLEGIQTRILDLTEILDRITVYDRDIAHTPANLGVVRMAANLLARLFKVER